MATLTDLLDLDDPQAEEFLGGMLTLDTTHGDPT
jgi:hypothetical protein